MKNTKNPIWIDSAITMLNRLVSGEVTLEFCHSNLENNPTEDYAFFTITSDNHLHLPSVLLMGGSALYNTNTINPSASFLKENKLDIEFAVIDNELRVILTRDCENFNSFMFQEDLAARAKTANNLIADCAC